MREALDEHRGAFCTRPPEGRYSHLFPDAKLEKVRGSGSGSGRVAFAGELAELQPA